MLRFDPSIYPIPQCTRVTRQRSRNIPKSMTSNATLSFCHKEVCLNTRAKKLRKGEHLWRIYPETSMASVAEENLETSSSARLKLYSYWRSSCAWRVRIALNLKGLPYEYKAVNLVEGEQFSEEYTELNPTQYVPTLVDGDIVVGDSLAILLYLEDKYPEHPLLPDDLQLKAISLQVAAIVGSSIQPLQNLVVLRLVEEKLGPEERGAWVKRFIEKGFSALERLLKNIAGKYCIGDRVTLADVFIAPQVAAAAGRFDVDMLKFPTLNKINQSLVDLPEFLAAVPERQPDSKAV